MKCLKTLDYQDYYFCTYLTAYLSLYFLTNSYCSVVFNRRMEQHFSVFYFTCDHVLLCVVMLKYSLSFIDAYDDIYLLQLCFQPVAVVSNLAQKYKRDRYIQNKKQYTNNTKTLNT